MSKPCRCGSARFFALGSFVHAEKNGLSLRCAPRRNPQRTLVSLRLRRDVRLVGGRFSTPWGGGWGPVISADFWGAKSAARFCWGGFASLTGNKYLIENPDIIHSK